MLLYLEPQCDPLVLSYPLTQERHLFLTHHPCQVLRDSQWHQAYQLQICRAFQMGPLVQLRLDVLEPQKLQCLFLLWSQEDQEYQDVPSNQTHLFVPLTQGSQMVQVFHLKKFQQVQVIHTDQVHLWHPLVQLRQVRLYDQGCQSYLVFHGHLGNRVYQLESSQGVREDLQGLVVQYVPYHSFQEVQMAPLVLPHLEDLEDLGGL